SRAFGWKKLQGLLDLQVRRFGRGRRRWRLGTAGSASERMRVGIWAVLDDPIVPVPDIKLPIRTGLGAVPLTFVRDPEADAGLRRPDGDHLHLGADADAG